MFEEDMLYPPNDPRLAKINKIKQGKIDYLEYREAIEDVLTNPLGYKDTEISEPPAGWMSEVHYWMTQYLKLKDWSCVKVYPAIGTALDRYHGIDLLVQYTDPESGRIIDATVDFTLSKGNVDKGSYKADVTVNQYGAMANDRFPLVGGRELEDIEHGTLKEDKIREQERRQAVAKVIAEVLEEKMKQAVKEPEKRLQKERQKKRRHLRDLLYS